MTNTNITKGTILQGKRNHSYYVVMSRNESNAEDYDTLNLRRIRNDGVGLGRTSALVRISTGRAFRYNVISTDEIPEVIRPWA